MSIQHNDLHSNVRVIAATPPRAIGTTGTGQVGAVIDRQGFGGLEFLVSYGTVVATGASVSATVRHGDTSGALTSAADYELLGVELHAGLAAGARTSGTGKNVVTKIGYRGPKRYVQLALRSTVSAGIPVSVSALLFDPQSSKLIV
jgi:hypothetical protein